MIVLLTQKKEEKNYFVPHFIFYKFYTPFTAGLDGDRHNIKESSFRPISGLAFGICYVILAALSFFLAPKILMGWLTTWLVGLLFVWFGNSISSPLSCLGPLLRI
jgi:predicted permease